MGYIRGEADMLGEMNHAAFVCSDTKKTKLRGLSPRVNYTDRAAAAGRRS